MYIPGHLSVGYLLFTVVRNPKETHPFFTGIFPVLLGTLTPDIIDKSILFIGLSPYGRLIGHSILFLMAITLLYLGLRKIKAPFAASIIGLWTLGVGSHLLVDLFDDLVNGILYTDVFFSSWFLWPFLTPESVELKLNFLVYPCNSCYTPLEFAVLLLAFWIGWKRYHRPGMTTGDE